MSEIITLDDWKNNWIENYKTCYYPFFLYSLPVFDDKLKNQFDVDGQIRFHINNFKHYLLYFDYVLIPLGNLIRPINNHSANVFNELLENREVLNMIEQKLLISTIYKDQNIIDTFKIRLEYLKEINWEVKSDLYQKLLKYEIDNFLFYERNVSNEILLLDKLIRKRIENYPDNKKKEKILSILKSSETNSSLYFSHEIFTTKIIKSKEEDLYNFLIETNYDYYAMSELGNPGAVLPFVEGNDNILRKSKNTEIYNYLYSIKTFKIFLGLFIKEDLIEKISLMSVIEIKSMRNRSYWLPFVGIYHKLLTEVSSILDNLEPHKFDKFIDNSFDKKFRSDKFSVLIDSFLIVLNGLFTPLKKIFDIKQMSGLFNHKKNLAFLRLVNRDVYEYIIDLTKILNTK